MGFPGRMKLHDEIVRHFKNRLLPEGGYPCSLFGIEVSDTIKIHESLRYLYDDSTARFVKHLPDLLFVKEEKVYLVDVKTLTRYDTDSFSCELDSHKVLMDLVSIGCKVIVSYNTIPDFPYNLKACFVDEIDFHYTNKRPGANVGGSRTAFGLFYKISSYIKSLDVFLDNLRAICTCDSRGKAWVLRRLTRKMSTYGGKIIDMPIC